MPRRASTKPDGEPVNDRDEVGSVTVFHTNAWRGARRTNAHWRGDLPEEAARECLDGLMHDLAAGGWQFESKDTKVLMLTHSALAKEQGYEGIVEALDRISDRFVRKEDPYIKLFADVVEPVCDAFRRRRFGEMFSLVGRGPALIHRADKEAWSRGMVALNDLRATGTIGAVVDRLVAGELVPIPDDVSRVEAELALPAAALDERGEKRVGRARALRAVAYREVTALTNFINEATPFATKHGVKGAEFENVLVVVGRGWSAYDFNKMLEWFAGDVPLGKQAFFESNRNLFYVAISRPKRRLAVLFTQELSNEALDTLGEWFGPANVRPVA